MDPIQFLGLPKRDSEKMREDLYAMFARESAIKRRRRRGFATRLSTRIRRPRRRRLAVAVAH